MAQTLRPFPKTQSGLHPVVNLSGWRLWLSLEPTMFLLCSLDCQTAQELESNGRDVRFNYDFQLCNAQKRNRNGWVFFSHGITFSGEGCYESLSPGCDSGLRPEIPPPRERDAVIVCPYLLSHCHNRRHEHENATGRRPPGI